MEPGSTPKTSPTCRWQKRKLLKEKAEAARKKCHCTSSAGSSASSADTLQETTATFSGGTAKVLDFGNQDERQGVEGQESKDSKFEFGCSEAMMENLREWINVELKRND